MTLRGNRRGAKVSSRATALAGLIPSRRRWPAFEQIKEGDIVALIELLKGRFAAFDDVLQEFYVVQRLQGFVSHNPMP